ncbi:hypothetical protein GOB07_30720 [Sinorhizobium meliloti]|nr:hypothetical protein SinmeB_5883 [Sinorhizobium meliloti BL225C]ASQ01950.1 hypothetical protein CDO24_32380 [Sinorhizobium meliloti]ASQ12715.1 hypothetical protein CDO22_22020 [Sinorhizobium meliloti]MDW9372020.1 hypothetical protein [Sinorhizobium meliloti]MDW9401086.1 hypothetical protein [Sinorhizobium meliloti]
MHLVVCIKQVPDSAQIRVHPVTNTIMHQGVPTVINAHASRSLHRALAGSLRSQPPGELTCSALSKVPALPLRHSPLHHFSALSEEAPTSSGWLPRPYDIVLSPCRLYDTDCSFNRAANFRSNSLKNSH